MNKSLVIGLVIGVAVAAGAGALASFTLRGRDSEYAKVLRVTPLTKTISMPRQSCHDEQVTRTIKVGHDPGDRIPVRNGQLVLDDSATTDDKKG